MFIDKIYVELDNNEIRDKITNEQLLINECDSKTRGNS